MAWPNLLFSTCNIPKDGDYLPCGILEHSNLFACIIPEPEDGRLAAEDEDDGYDPRKSEYIWAATQSEVDAHNAQLFQQQVAKLEAMVVRSQRLGCTNELVKNYEDVLSVMRSSGGRSGPALQQAGAPAPKDQGGGEGRARPSSLGEDMRLLDGAESFEGTSRSGSEGTSRNGLPRDLSL